MNRAVWTYLFAPYVILQMVACTTTAPVKEDLPAVDARFRSAYQRDAGIEAASALSEMARRYPAALSRYPDPVIGATVFMMLGSAPAEKTAKLELLRQLHAQHWMGHSGVEPSYIWGELVSLLVERGSLKEARDVLADIRSARPLLRLRIDNRYNLLMREGARTPSVESAAKLEVEDWQRAMRKFPRRLQVTVGFLSAAQSAGSYTESLAVADSVLAKLATGAFPAGVYEDTSLYLSSVHELRAWALIALGEWPLAETDMWTAAELERAGAQDVSCAINLASYYANLERPDEAMTALGPLVEPDARESKYGVMAAKLVLYKVALLKSNAVAARELFEFMNQHRADSLKIFQTALLLADRQDEGAALLIDRLRDPEQRADALEAVQTYAGEPHLPLNVVICKRWNELVNRSDVRAAISEVGIVERFAIPAP